MFLLQGSSAMYICAIRMPYVGMREVYERHAKLQIEISKSFKKTLRVQKSMVSVSRWSLRGGTSNLSNARFIPG